MPLYNFQCESCDQKFEELVPYDRRHEVHCPECQSRARVLVSGFAVGSGAGAGGSGTVAPARKAFS